MEHPYPSLYQVELAAREGVLASLMDGWMHGPITLVGDACQAVSLMAGQGASMALGGAYVLADELRHGGAVEAAAARYEQRIRPFIRAKQKAGRRTARWLVPTSPWRITTRAIAFAAAQLPGMTPLMRPRVRRHAGQRLTPPHRVRRAPAMKTTQGTGTAPPG